MMYLMSMIIDWEEVENVLKFWMVQNYKEIRVDLHLHFKNTRPMAPAKAAEDLRDPKNTAKQVSLV
jgi:hypothetical protein